jgi:acyl-coenzyme A synthetase/AMP-(fatty) acid ligase
VESLLNSPQKAEEYKMRAGPVPDKLLYDLVKEYAKKFPGYEIITDKEAEPARRVTYGEFLQLVDACYGSLAALGIQAGDVVAIQLPDWLELWYTRIALARIGAVSFPFSEAINEEDVAYLLEITQPKYAIISGRTGKINYPQIYGEFQKNNASLLGIFVVGRYYPWILKNLKN